MTAFLIVHTILWLVGAGAFVLATADDPGLKFNSVWFAILATFLGMAGWSIYLLLLA